MMKKSYCLSSGSLWTSRNDSNWAHENPDTQLKLISACLLSFLITGVFIHLVTKIVSGLQLSTVDLGTVRLGTFAGILEKGFFFPPRSAKLVKYKSGVSG